jgi:hypothetical protein
VSGREKYKIGEEGGLSCEKLKKQSATTNNGCTIYYYETRIDMIMI